MSGSNDYSACWASCLGDCGEGMSHEHLISECLFPGGDIMVRGFSWCKDAARPLRIERLKKRILCRRHNGSLSRVDSASKKSVLTMMEASDLFMTRNALRQRRWTVKHFDVDMLLLERWCLKTLINLNHIHGWQIGDEASNPHKPTQELIEVAYGLRRFTDSKGLYIPGKAGDNITPDEGRFQFRAFTDGNRLIGGRFSLWGFPFVMSIFPSPIRTSDGTHLMRHNIKHGFKTRDDKGRDIVSHFVNFRYPTESDADQRPGDSANAPAERDTLSMQISVNGNGGKLLPTAV